MFTGITFIWNDCYLCYIYVYLCFYYCAVDLANKDAYIKLNISKNVRLIPDVSGDDACENIVAGCCWGCEWWGCGGCLWQRYHSIHHQNSVIYDVSTYQPVGLSELHCMAVTICRRVCLYVCAWHCLSQHHAAARSNAAATAAAGAGCVVSSDWLMYYRLPASSSSSTRSLTSRRHRPTFLNRLDKIVTFSCPPVTGYSTGHVISTLVAQRKDNSMSGRRLFFFFLAEQKSITIVIARTISPTPSLFVAQRPSTYSQENMGKFGETRGGVGKVACWSTVWSAIGIIMSPVCLSVCL